MLNRNTRRHGNGGRFGAQVNGCRISSSPVSSMDNMNVKCFVCSGTLRGMRKFITECRHSFHFFCLDSKIRHGIKICPPCGRHWSNLPTIIQELQMISSNPSPPPIYPTPNFMPQSYPAHNNVIPTSSSHNQEPPLFNDDDPLLPPSTTSSHQQITLQTHTELPSLPTSKSSSNFSVLIRAIAPSTSSDLQHHTPIDVVLVLDVSGSMAGPILSLLKQAVTFVIENLGTRDRLSIVTFSTTAHRVYPLRRMSPGQAKENAIKVVNSLWAAGGTNIMEGLRKGIRVLHERRERNPVASVLLLSDGLDNTTTVGTAYVSHIASIISATAAAIGSGNPVHTFGFGGHHNTNLLHGLANATEGTFSFIESMEMIGEAFARCIGGLLSVVAKDLIIRVWSSASTGVKIVRIPAVGSQLKSGGTKGVINVGMLYADEEKRFLLHLLVPSVVILDDDHNEEIITKLLDLSCEYKVPPSEVITLVEGETVKIQRTRRVLPSMLAADPLVVRDKNKLEMVDDIEQAMSLADSGDLVAARSLLQRRAELLRAAAAELDDSQNYYAPLNAELEEIKRRMGSMEMYKQMGRAFILSGLNAHGLQRATTRGNGQPGCLPMGNGYDTPGILNMVNKCKLEPPGSPPPPMDNSNETKMGIKCKLESPNSPPGMSKRLKKCKLEKL